jgi:hypothetical protein
MGRPPIGKVAMTSTERVHRFRAKHRQDKPETKQSATAVAALEARVRELEAELARERQRREDAEGEMLGQRFAPKPRAAKPRAEKPPLPPDEERDRIIKNLKTRVRNLTAELDAEREWHKHKADGSMNFQTMSAIANALHPDRKPSEAEREKACKAFTAWKADKDKARRHTR